ncbi:MAG: hypothetical protein J7494_02575 [Sphingobium sp.]|nr:hypothetical protein [Sphingobium sp.]
MKAYVLLGLAVAAPALAQAPAGKLPDEAARIAMDVCADHASSAIPIEGKSGAQLDAKGVIYQLNPPDFLSSTKASAMGIAQYAKSPSTSGEIWAIGYDSGGCMVVSLGVPVADSEKGIVAFFEGAKGWRSERPSASAKGGEKLLGFAANPRRNLKLTALVKLQDANNTTTVVITRSAR